MLSTVNFLLIVTCTAEYTIWNNTNYRGTYLLYLAFAAITDGLCEILAYRSSRTSLASDNGVLILYSKSPQVSTVEPSRASPIVWVKNVTMTPMNNAMELSLTEPTVPTGKVTSC